MALILISYDLTRGTQDDYNDLYRALKRNGWWHYLESTWIIPTNESPEDVWERLKPFFDNDDRVIIVDITEKSRQGWLPKRAWQWLRRHQ